ncbi:thiol-disulfide oxidoreductase [Roseivivax halodurans JCM 10272]|uniref:Thiol-disulfide oxidoreductase n=1 Tax=Roseivivax halodurans JCM 10272 TaxID=1449350 RepID=X7EL41_9RHOB|nr:DCC1-like thiol-disulfide oxidoreductase family protein [Roseivivax halodurans]ETX15858.1 thiol-disulfide oxidoreductase [Roseivivax halodurans JCM 10272]
MSAEITVIYNDTCPICAREVASYKRMTASDPGIGFRGLSEGELESFGITRRAAARRFHVVRDGVLYDGVPAFAIVWDRIPRLRWLARLVRTPGIRQGAALLYDHVAAPALFALHKRRERLGKAYRRG